MSMNRIILIMLLLFVLEGALVPWLIPAGFGHRIIPQFVFVFVIFASIYTGRHRGLLLGAGFGLLQDIVYYGHLLGPHAFIMASLGYFAGMMFEKRRATILMALSIVGMACILYDSALFFIYRIFRITNDTYAWAVLDYILPSLFLQLAFALACYVPARRMFERLVHKGADNDEE